MTYGNTFHFSLNTHQKEREREKTSDKMVEADKMVLTLPRLNDLEGAWAEFNHYRSGS